MSMKPATLVLRTAGTNCDLETAHAFELAGSTAKRVHLNQVLRDSSTLSSFQILAIPGGFSYGDDIAAGRIFANQITHHLGDAFRAFIDAGKPVIGICNGFQVLIKTDLLPGPIGGASGQTCTLAQNDCQRFVDRWIWLAPQGDKCIWTRDLEPLELPVAHGEGKFVPASAQVRRELWESKQVALTYIKSDRSPAGGSFPENPNGSIDDIAGICDASGLVLGLMPHPERHISSLQHPAWTRSNGKNPQAGSGLKLFVNAVQHAAEAVGTGV